MAFSVNPYFRKIRIGLTDGKTLAGVDNLQPCRRAGELERMEERIKTGIEQMGQRLQTVEKEW
jgi:hypothetical protein